MPAHTAQARNAGEAASADTVGPGALSALWRRLLRRRMAVHIVAAAAERRRVAQACRLPTTGVVVRQREVSSAACFLCGARQGYIISTTGGAHLCAIARPQQAVSCA